MTLEKILEGLLNKARGDEDVLAVILFGSAGRGEATEGSDVDICLVLQANKAKEALQASLKRMEYLGFAGVDAHIFQHLPLYIRRRVLKEGKVLFVRDEEALYELAFRTAQAFEDFKHIYYGYLEEIAHA
jgi:predicted nucleotidyltransferase